MQKEVKSHSTLPVAGAFVVSTEASIGSALVELAALKTLTETRQIELKAKIEETDCLVAEFKTSMQENLKKM